MENKSPAFQFYPSDFLADRNVMLMTAEEIGAYILLLSVCWIEGELPNDLEELAMLARVPFERFKLMWEKRIQVTFNLLEETNTLVHKRLQLEKHKQEEWRKKCAKGGRNSARKPKKTKDIVVEQGSSTKDQVNEQGSSTLQSSSSSSKETKVSRGGTPWNAQSQNPVNPQTEELLGTWLDGIAKILGAKSRHTLANAERWEKVCIMAFDDDKTFPELQSAVRSEFDKNKEKPQFFTPENVLKQMQLASVQASTPFINPMTGRGLR